MKDQYGDDISATLNVECLSRDVSGKVPADVSGANYYTYDNDKTVTFKNSAEKKEIMYTRFLTRKMARKLLQRQLVLQ